MKKDIKEFYNELVANKFIVSNSRQVNAIENISLILQQNNKKSFFSNKKIQGIYVWGSTGIGKTFILNLFITNVLNRKKYHFNHFMINLHAFIHNNNNKKDSTLESYIQGIAKKYKVIFIDEMHIFKIVDALLIKKIFILFQKYKIFILISSNFIPNELYKDGLQRNDFLPFIEFIETNFKVLHLEQIQDYRRIMLNQSKTYFTPVNDKTSHEFKKLFERFVDIGQIYIRKIQTKSRTIRFEKCTANIAYCKFNDLCATNLGHEDYRNIASAFSLIFIADVPQFTDLVSDQCRRFISLIDMLYDQQCSVVLLAQYPINQLCLIKSLNKEFERTASRLYEMTIIDFKKQ